MKATRPDHEPSGSNPTLMSENPSHTMLGRLVEGAAHTDTRRRLSPIRAEVDNSRRRARQLRPRVGTRILRFLAGEFVQVTRSRLPS
jgi:hypothetical protein